MKTVVCYIVAALTLQTIQAQTSYTWNGSVSAAWAAPANWSPAGIPGASDNIQVVAAPNTCTLGADLSISNIILTGGTLDLGGYTLTAAGATATFSSGVVQNGRLVVTATGTTVFGPGAVTMNCAVDIQSASLNIRNATFNGNTFITKTGATHDGGNNNTFNAPVTITNAGAGNITFGNTNADRFNAGVTVINSGSAHIYLANNSAGNYFGSTTTFHNESSGNGNIYVSYYSAGTVFDGDIFVSATGGNGVFFCTAGTASATITSGYTVSVDAPGFSQGSLSLRGITQQGTVPVNLALTGTAGLIIANSSQFNAPLTVSSPNINISHSVFDNDVTLTKTDGASSNSMAGGNIFNGTLTVNYFSSSGTGYWSFAYGNPDIYNGDVYSNNNSLDRIIFGHNATGNQFNGDFIITQTGSSRGTALTWSTGSSCEMAAGKTIRIGAGEMDAGYFYVQGITQHGNEPIYLHTTGNVALYLGAGSAQNHSALGGPVEVTAEDVYIRGTTFHSDVVVTKTGGTNNHNEGRQNIFNGTLTINQHSNTGYFMLGYNSNDRFNENIIVNATGSGGINLGWTSGTGNPELAAGKTVVVGAGGYDAGQLQFGGFVQHGNTPITLSLTGTAFLRVYSTDNPSVFGGPFTVQAPDIYIRGGIFNNITSLTKTGGTSNHNGGRQNIFNGPLTINQQSNTGYFMLGYNSNDLFNDDIVLNATGTGGINFGWIDGTGAPVLAAGKTMSVGTDGFSAGYLRLSAFTQLGTVPINLVLTGSAQIQIMQNGIPSNIGGAFTVMAPDIYVQGAVFNRDATFIKTGGVANTNSNRRNVFHGLLTIHQQSNSNFVLSANTDDAYNDDIIVTSSGSGGIYFGNSATSSPVLAAGKTILIGGAGFTNGFLTLHGFTQLGNAPMTLAFSGTTTFVRFMHNSVIGGNLVVTSPEIRFDGCTFHGTVNATMTGDRAATSRGGNTFNRHCSITNSGGHYWVMGNNEPDTWNDDVVLTSNGTERLLLAWNVPGNLFNGDIYVNTAGSATGIEFCGGSGTATATLSAGKTIASGVIGLNTGYLILRRFTQLGNAPVHLNLPATASYLQLGPSSTLGGNVISVSPGLRFNGCTFHGTVNSTKTGDVNETSSGNNIFNGNTVISNTGAGNLVLGNSNADQFNTTATFNNTGTAHFYIAHNSSNNHFGGVTTFNNAPSADRGIYVSSYSAGTVFTENIIVSSTGGQGVQFCASNTTASATLATGKTIAVGAGGFSAGTLLLKQFTQVGSAAQSLSLTGAARLQFGPSSNFGGNITSSSPGLFFNGAVFSGMVNSQKTGAGNDGSTGNNRFNNSTTITNAGTGNLSMGVSADDYYNGDIHFIKSGSGPIYPNYHFAGYYRSNVRVSSATPITFGVGNGVTVFDGHSAQAISSLSSIPVISRMVVYHSGSGITLNNPVHVSITLNLLSGLVHTTPVNILTMLNNSYVGAGNALSTSYINGPMRYQKSSSGASVLNFPVGKASDCRPVVLTVAHTNGTAYTYYVELHNASAAALGYTLPPTVDAVSTVHYYTINRLDASGNIQPTSHLSGNQQVEIFFGQNDLITDGNATTIVKNTPAAPTAWIDIGGTDGPVYNGGLNLTGSIKSTSSPTAFNSFSHFALAYRTMIILADNSVQLEAAPAGDMVSLQWKATAGHASYALERSSDGILFEVIHTLSVNEPGSGTVAYHHKDHNPHTGRNIYRVKRMNADGSYTYSNVVSVQFSNRVKLSVYPNPSVGMVSVRGLSADRLHAAWYDLGGRLVLTQSETVVNGTAGLVTNLPDGIYILRFNDAGIPKAERIIIRR